MEKEKIFTKPFSTLVYSDSSNKINVDKIIREKTNIKSLLKYKTHELYRLYSAKLIRILPEPIRDRIIENKYKILGSKASSIEIQAGSLEAAPAEIIR